MKILFVRACGKVENVELVLWKAFQYAVIPPFKSNLTTKHIITMPKGHLKCDNNAYMIEHTYPSPSLSCLFFFE